MTEEGQSPGSAGGVSPWIEVGSARGEISGQRCPQLSCHIVSNALPLPSHWSLRVAPAFSTSMFLRPLIGYRRSHDGMYLYSNSLRVAAKNSIHEKPPLFCPASRFEGR